MLRVNSFKNALLISLVVYVAVVSMLLILETHRSEKEFKSIEKSFELYKSSAILAGLLIEAKLDDVNQNKMPQSEIDASQRVISLFEMLN